ncbi:AzlD domain-containing protein [Clostridium aestuarii]|uniref:AzlD domain-containing protein n=1 Tax=Clostridium aestuarii TaxID=338193 RepID=A0ABT4CWB4_9CLOT|nr:AzlD domain-containing protein [Clostridium aestuarii]MCY6483279.1 AzlD domain-containing protein [Clostridium aestuarii]
MNKVMLLIIGMMLVTYIPRILPFYIVERLNLSDKVKRSLTYIPYAALGAMVIPGGFSAVEGHPLISICALGIAILLSFIKENLFIAVTGSVLFAYVCLLMI